MADPDPTNILGPNTIGSVYVSEESTFGTHGTEVRAYPVTGTLSHEETQTELDRMNLRATGFDYLDPIKGLKSGSVKFEYYLQPSSQTLNSSLSPTSIAETPLAILMRTILGGESKNYGSVVASGGAATGCVVTAGHGSYFPAGQIALVEDPDANTGLLPVRILTRSTDTLTWWPNLSGAILTAGNVINTWTWYPTVTNTKSCSVAIAASQDSYYQWLHEGCVGSLDLKLERDNLARVAFDLKSAEWTGPSSQSYAVTASADSMAAPLACRIMGCYLQAPGTTTRTIYQVDAIAVKINSGTRHIENLTGTVEGRYGVMRTEGVAGPFAEITLTVRAHRDADATWWTSRTGLSLMVFWQVGSLGYERTIVIDAPLCVLVGKPKVEDKTNDEVKMTLTLRTKLDTSCTGSSTELATAPLRIAIG